MKECTTENKHENERQAHEWICKTQIEFRHSGHPAQGGKECGHKCGNFHTFLNIEKRKINLLNKSGGKGTAFAICHFMTS
jgi:hypothetical protein